MKPIKELRDFTEFERIGNSKLFRIKGEKGIYNYDDKNCKLMDDKGNVINIKIPDYKQISLNNLGLYCDFLFKDYTDGINRFLTQCREGLKSDSMDYFR